MVEHVSVGSEDPESSVSRHILGVLDPLLGRFTARRALELAAGQCGATLDSLGAATIEGVCDGLRPMLRTLIGAGATAEVLAAIARPYRSEGGQR